MAYVIKGGFTTKRDVVKQLAKAEKVITSAITDKSGRVITEAVTDSKQKAPIKLNCVVKNFKTTKDPFNSHPVVDAEGNKIELGTLKTVEPK